MASDGEEFSPLGVAGALASAYARDTRGFLPLLAIVLEGALPEETEITRKGGLFVRQKPIQKVAVTLGDTTYAMEDTGRGPLSAQRIKVVRGIVLKTETVPVDEWLTELSAHVSARAGQNERAFFALQKLLEG